MSDGNQKAKEQGCNLPTPTAMDNPPGNSLPNGISNEQVLAAINSSGYPLQTTVARLLQAEFDIQPEWGFLDRTTGAQRAIDLLAMRRPHDRLKTGHDYVMPELALIVECKQSQLPYVFFEHSAPIKSGNNFPHISGLRNSDIELYTDVSNSIWKYPLLAALSMLDEPFLRAPAECSTLSKCVRKGSTVALSGSESYEGTVLPIRSAVDHFRQRNKPNDTFRYFSAVLTIGIAVLDAPMVSTQVADNGDSSIEFKPWVRLWRHEPPATPNPFGDSDVSAIDFIHRDFLATYVHNHLLPFFDVFQEKISKHSKEVAAGEGFVPGLAGMRISDIEKHLSPRTKSD
ncbi:hypothetical protein [Nocardia fluminea]|uniref:Uncharacterized protein n=1 Tax=Nocardia fluminea TaxID=134984 RepID=A0A2N3WY03_9NOCA|nr:hypothetical protein [Nocardia fluminea]PKV98740.1 hypothetical protein ATK86_0765 [Nocardia fluminea]